MYANLGKRLVMMSTKGLPMLVQLFYPVLSFLSTTLSFWSPLSQL